MSLLNALRHQEFTNLWRRSQRASPISLRPHHVVSTTLSRPRWQAWRASPALIRSESTAGAAATTTRDTGGFKYPEILNVYRPSTNATLFIGITRTSSIGVFLFGTLYFSSALFFSPDHSNLWIPLVPLVSAIPMVTMAMCTGPMIHGISAVLPSWARRSQHEVLRFASDPPADTRLQLWFMRFSPWPQVREVRLADLRRVRPSWRAGIANLEHVPAANSTHRGSIWYVLARNYMGRFYVNMAQTRDKSAAPGVWKHVWEQIPMKGQPLANPQKSMRPERPWYAKPVHPNSPAKITRPSK